MEKTILRNGGAVKILCVSDTEMPQLHNAVNLRRQYSDIDMIISCGDMPPGYLDFITSIIGVPLFYVRGNHDERYDEEPPGGIDLHRTVVEFRGLTLAGLEGSIRYNNGDIQYTQFQMQRMVLGLGADDPLEPLDARARHRPLRHTCASAGHS